METRPRTRLLRRAVVTAALGALVVPATAGAAVKTKPPVITKVTPMSVSVGETLTIHGKNFRSGKGKNTLLFKRDKGKALFLKAGLSTKKKITIVVPKSLEKYMAVEGGTPTATRFRLRVLTSKLSKSFTAGKSSPVIGPAKPKATDSGVVPVGPVGPVAPACPVGGPNDDDDGDLLPNWREKPIGTHKQAIGTDPCAKDTDGDGVTDFYEYSSAVDLNRGNWSTSLPYPGLRPYPNPLDGGDGDTDHDGDSMTLYEEYLMWSDPRYGKGDPVLNYSAGKQETTRPDATAPAAALRLSTPDAIYRLAPSMHFLDSSGNREIEPDELLALDFNRSGAVSDTEFTYQDFNKDGVLGDNESDVDGDGLTNYDEQHGRMTPGYWKDFYTGEKPYTNWVAYDTTEFITADTDGDGDLDALDDQDNDSFSNISELSRRAAQPVGIVAAPWSIDGRVNPLNPCLPATVNPPKDLLGNPLTTLTSPTCMSHPPISSGPAPFDVSPRLLQTYEVKD